MQKLSDSFKLLNSEVAYTRNIHINKKGKGIFLSEEWGNVRRLTFNFFENPNEQNYRLHSYSELEIIIFFGKSNEIELSLFILLKICGEIISRRSEIASTDLELPASFDSIGRR